MIGIINLLDEYLLKSEDSWNRRSHYASDANACVRQLVHKWRSDAMSDPPTAGDILKWRMGAAAESLVYGALDYAKSMGLLIDWDNQVKREVEVPGLCHPVVVKMDAMLHLPDGDTLGLEVKSMFGRGIVNIQRTGKPKEENMVQVYFYLTYGGVPRFALVYLGRDFGYRTEFLVSLDEKGGLLCNGNPYPIKPMEHFIERFKLVESYLEGGEFAGEVPPRDYIHAIKDGELRDEFQLKGVKHKTDWQCAYCAWKTACWNPMLKMYPSGTNADMFEAREKSGGQEQDAE
jgi:hypothetical protein